MYPKCDFNYTKYELKTVDASTSTCGQWLPLGGGIMDDYLSVFLFLKFTHCFLVNTNGIFNQKTPLPTPTPEKKGMISRILL